jgi:hypothetical protein
MNCEYILCMLLGTTSGPRNVSAVAPILSISKNANNG